MVYLYDTTQRDGAQTPHLGMSLEGKLRVTELLHSLGIPYIEGGFAGSNPRDEAYFNEVLKRRESAYLPGSKIVAFGMTAKKEDVGSDEYLKAVAGTRADAYTIVGKAHKGHVEEVLRLTPHEYLRIIEGSIDYLKSTGKEVFFDAEHFFDGYKFDPDYAFRALEAAKNADCIVLCDTNGKSWPEDVYRIVSEAKSDFPNQLGIHCHDDRGLAVANSLTAVRAGAEQVQGTINGLGERAGNANLNTLLFDLYELGYPVITPSGLKKLTCVATEVGRITGRRVPYNMPLVGPRVFYHTGGLHTDAMTKMPGSYEHTDPASVGNERYFVLSEQAGKAAVRWWADKFGFAVHDDLMPGIMEEVNDIRVLGEAQAYLLLRRRITGGDFPFEIISGKVFDTFNSLPEATIKIRVNGNEYHEASAGDGPVNALDMTLRKALEREHPIIKKLELVDFNVELPAGERGTEARVDVSITFRFNGNEFDSRATDTDIVKASKKALEDAYAYYLLRH